MMSFANRAAGVEDLLDVAVGRAFHGASPRKNLRERSSRSIGRESRLRSGPGAQRVTCA